MAFAGLGQPGRYTLCLAENEVRSPWPPLQVEAGLAAGTSMRDYAGRLTQAVVEATLAAERPRGVARIEARLSSPAYNVRRSGETAMIDSDKGRAEVSRFTIDMAVRLSLIAGVAYISVLLLRPVAPLLLWAVILTVAVFPLYAMLRRRVHLRAGLAATLLSFLLLVLLLTPVVLLSTSAVESLDSYGRMLLAGDRLIPPPPETVRDWPLVGQRAYELWNTVANDSRTVLSKHVGQIASVGRWIGQVAAGIALEVLQFAAAIVIAGVLLAYSEGLAATVRDLAGRIADSRGRHFVEIAGSTIRNVSQGVIGVALLQSALLGLGMLVAGVPFAGPITFACLVLAIVQVGPNIVMIPVIVWMWIDQPAAVAALFTVYTAPLLLLDNVLRPILMARGLQTPMAVILAGVICGTISGGLIGLFVGPVVLAVFYDLVMSWMGESAPVENDGARTSRSAPES